MSYLHSCIYFLKKFNAGEVTIDALKEVMRIDYSMFVGSQMLDRGLTLTNSKGEKINVPAGTDIKGSIKMYLSNPNNFTSPRKFDPSRWQT